MPGSCRIIDLEKSLVRLGHDQELLRDLIQIFLDDHVAMVAQVNESYNNKDPEGLRHAAHSLKGLVSNFEALRCVEAASQLETIAAENRWDEGEEAISQLTAEVEQVVNRLIEERSADQES